MAPETKRQPLFVLETRRLILRPITGKDVDAVYRLYAEWDVAKTLSRLPFPFSIDAAQRFVGEAESAFAQRSAWVLGAMERPRSCFVGIVSLRIPGIDPGVPEAERAEAAGLGFLGYAVARPHWGHGFATEAAARVIDFAFDDLRLNRLQASVLRDNPPSRRVLERLGFSLAEAGIIEEPLYGGPPRLVDRYLLRPTDAPRARDNRIDA
ncbi:MAG: GNAT family N-acetyltransferase [Chloroflexota bacterium]|nr:GNAT family N-acetyltransferase [Chloroflexota bacterium]